MSGLEIVAVIAVAYVIGRIRQWQKNRDAIKTAEGIKHITEAIRNHKEGNDK
ncbi:hypothetical protein E4N62_36110 [Streptomyces sp. MNU76]|uniref:hypothetical protein n=1 Tax=Streptomyces sp. MNU76 TaxID=2560026 RepID=UPI001E53EB93|nr:hypothetical protein [Streptomyces sp. MNU76]MCC9710215.1 hypothetical protein [Streptomyces sp. MNU76]